MHLTKTFLTFLSIACLGCGMESAPPEDSRDTPIIGVWAFVSETNAETGELVRDDSTWSGIWIFTEGYHCLARMDTRRNGLSDAELEASPLDEQVAHYQQLVRYSSTAGTYTIEGNTLRRQWQISLGPNLIGQASLTEFSVEGERLTLTLPGRAADSGSARVVVYRRLE